VPLSGPNAHRPYSGFVPGNPRMTRQIQAITADGRMFLVCGEPVAGARRILSVGMDGSAGKDLYVGPELPPGSRSATSTFLALSPDDRFLYVAGVTSKRGVANVVYRAWIADGADPVKPFLGVEYEEGGDEKHFKDPRGIGVDSRGRLYVCDYMNDRIQVFEAEGTFVKSLPVTGPEQVLVHPKTGALYVLSVADRGATEHYGSEVTWEIYQDKALVKYASLDDTNEVARLDLPKRKRHMHDVGPILALDASQASPVLWIANVGRQEPDDMLWKVVDSGPTLAKVAHNVLRLNRYQTISPALAADRANNELLAFGTPAGSVRIDPASGATRKIELAGAAGSNALARAGYAAFGHDGLLYVRSANPAEKAEHAWLIRRFDRTGALVPFGKAGEFIETNGRRQGGSPEYVGSFCVGADGRLYVVGMASRQDFTARVDVYGADGALLTKGLVQMTDNPGGVRVDAAGRVYVSDTLRPKGRDFPDFYPADPRKHFRTWYGSVLGFPPGGGSIRQADAAAMTDYARGNRPVKVEGALWSFYGVSPMPQQAGCLCVIADFDVDGWGRVFVPDVPGNCVAVLDRNGNVIMRFGSYGNADATGAGSAVPRPPIPLWFPERVAALDGDAFVVDSHNSRIVQVRLTGAAVEDVKLP
jgi:DNA-binding beta-propeller fold protein YncE